MDRVDLKEHAESDLAEEIGYKINGFVTVADAISEIEDIEDSFDAERARPYYSQQDDVISDYESDFGNDAEELMGETTYKAGEWQEAKTHYAYAVALAAYSSFFWTAKEELIDALEEFETDAARELEYDGEIQIQLSNTCSHGWASHDRELEDGTMIFESKQLDGCNGMERKIGEVWVSCCFDPKAAKEEEEPATAE